MWKIPNGNQLVVSRDFFIAVNLLCTYIMAVNNKALWRNEFIFSLTEYLEHITIFFNYRTKWIIILTLSMLNSYCFPQYNFAYLETRCTKPIISKIHKLPTFETIYGSLNNDISFTWIRIMYLCTCSFDGLNTFLLKFKMRNVSIISAIC